MKDSRSPIFFIKHGYIATFCWSKIGVANHLTLIVTNDHGKSMSIEFYPKDGNMMVSRITPQPGQLRAPDPIYQRSSDSRQAIDRNTGRPIRYILSAIQTKFFNDILYGNKCEARIHEGKLICSVPQMYSMLSFKNSSNERNCISWLTGTFRTLEDNLYGDSILKKDSKYRCVCCT